MWFFMIFCYVLVGLSGFGLIQIGLNHYFDFWLTNRITFDLMVSIIFIAAQTLVMFFFVGTGVNVREYLEEHIELGDDLYKKMFAIKRKLYPPTMMVTMLFMATVIIDGIYYIKLNTESRISEWWFHIFYILTLYYFFKSSFEQHKAFIGSTNIVLAMTENERK